MKKYDCVYCGGWFPRCGNTSSRCFGYCCGEYPGTGLGICGCSHPVEDDQEEPEDCSSDE